MLGALLLLVTSRLLALAIVVMIAMIPIVFKDLGLELDYLSIFIFLLFLAYISQSSLRLVGSLVEYLRRYNDDLTINDWGVLRQISSLVKYSRLRFGQWLVIFLVVLVIQPFLFEFLLYLIFAPIGFTVLHILEFEFDLTNLFTTVALMAILGGLIPGYFIFFDVLLGRKLKPKTNVFEVGQVTIKKVKLKHPEILEGIFKHYDTISYADMARLLHINDPASVKDWLEGQGNLQSLELVEKGLVIRKPVDWDEVQQLVKSYNQHNFRIGAKVS